MFLLLKELSPPDGLPARTHPLGRGVFNETPSHHQLNIIMLDTVELLLHVWNNTLTMNAYICFTQLNYVCIFGTIL